jgi:hypothetical protein
VSIKLPSTSGLPAPSSDIPGTSGLVTRSRYDKTVAAVNKVNDSSEAHCITVYKKKSTPSVTANNLSKLFEEGNILFNGGNLSQVECLNRFNISVNKSDSELCNILELKAKDFANLKEAKQMLNGSPSLGKI